MGIYNMSKMFRLMTSTLRSSSNCNQKFSSQLKQAIVENIDVRNINLQIKKINNMFFSLL